MPRLFVALPIDPRTEAALDGAARRLARFSGNAVRWVQAGRFHLTLRFLGDTPEAAVVGLRDDLALGLAGRIAPILRVRELGTFPERGPARVIWAGLGGDLSELRGLAAAVEEACRGRGFSAETRPFRPHLTLGRVRRGRPVPGELAEALAEVAATLSPPEFRATEVILYNSRLGGREGPSYEALAGFPLEAA